MHATIYVQQNFVIMDSGYYTRLQCTRFCSPKEFLVLYKLDITYLVITYPHLVRMLHPGCKALTATSITYMVLLEYYCHLST